MHILYQPIDFATIPAIIAPTIDPIGTIMEHRAIAIGNFPVWTKITLTGIWDGTMRPIPAAASARNISTATYFSERYLLTKSILKNELITVPESIIFVAPKRSDSLLVRVIKTIVIIVSIFRIHEACYDVIFNSVYMTWRFVFIWTALIDYIKIGIDVTHVRTKGFVYLGLNFI